MSEQTPRHALEEAARIYGSEAALARKLSVSRGALNQWKQKGREVPAEHAPVIEELTGVSCERLCPSIRWSVLRSRTKTKRAEHA